MTTDKLLATWFGAGLLPKAPGTWGSLAALPLGWAIQYFTGWAGLAVAALVVFLVGIWAADAYAKRGADPDPGEIVIDEVAGQWLALLPAMGSPVFYLAGFLLFRLFDIWKPWPIRTVERRLKGGLGVMADDILAGLIAAALLCGFRYVWGDFDVR